MRCNWGKGDRSQAVSGKLGFRSKRARMARFGIMIADRSFGHYWQFDCGAVVGERETGLTPDNERLRQTVVWTEER